MDKSHSVQLAQHPAHDADFHSMYAMHSRYADDKISLVDLGKVLVRRKVTMALVFMATVGLAVAFAAIKPKIYDYNSAVSIGQIQNKEGEYRLIESTEFVLNKVSNSFIPDARLALAETFESEEFVPEIDASIPKDSDLLLLKSTVRQDDKSLEKVRELHQLVIKVVTENHQQLTSRRIEELSIAQFKLQDEVEHLNQASVLNQKLAQLNAQQVNLKLKLEKASNKTLISIQLDRLQQKLDSERQVFEGLNQQIKNLQQRIALQPEKKQLVARQLKKAEAELENLQKSRSLAAASAGGEALLMVDSQIQSARDNVSALEQKLLIGIPDEAGVLQKQYVEILAQKDLQQAKLAEAEKAVAEFRIVNSIEVEKAQAELAIIAANITNEKVEHNRQIARLSREIDELENLKQQIIPTRVQIQPHRSIKATGTSSMLILILGIVLGSFAAVIAAFIKEFFSRVYDSIDKDVAE